ASSREPRNRASGGRFATSRRWCWSTSVWTAPRMRKLWTPARGWRHEPRPGDRVALSRTALVATLLLALALPASALAQGAPAPGSTPAAKAGSPTSTSGVPPSGEPAANLTEARAIRIARTDPKVAEQAHRYGQLAPSAQR